jgi:hypothetical protein
LLTRHINHLHQIPCLRPTHAYWFLTQSDPARQRVGVEVEPDTEDEEGQRDGDGPEDPEGGGKVGLVGALGWGVVEELSAEDCLWIVSDS